MNLDPGILYGTGLSTLLLLAGHYARRYFEREGEFETPVLICYAYGTLALWAGVALWLDSLGLWPLAWGVLAVDILAGLLVILLYGLDHWVRSQKRKARRHKVEWAERLSGDDIHQ
jgi:hypothetical protein